MGFFRSIGRFVSRAMRVVRFISNFTPAGLMKNLVSKGLSLLKKPLAKLAGKVFKKLPFLRVFKPFVDKFLKNPLGFLAGGPLGMLAQSAAQAVKGSTGLSGVLGGLTRGLGSPLPVALSPQGLSNVANIMAYTQAQQLLGRLR